MYFRITKPFLKQRTKEDLIDTFDHLEFAEKLPKTKIITMILESFPKSSDIKPWLLICPFCRNTSYFASTGAPIFCAYCGRTSPSYSHENNIKKVNQLIILSTIMEKGEQQLLKQVLLEQAVVAVITGLEVLMRDVYSLIYDHTHILIGRPIYEDIRARSRNEFLNLGSASRGLLKVTNLDIKKELSRNDYKYLSRMYSARHIIVHNSAIKDIEYLNQTGDPKSELGQSLKLYIEDLRRLIRLSRFIGMKISKKLQNSILSNHQSALSISRSIKNAKNKKRCPNFYKTGCGNKIVVYPANE